MDVYWSDRSTAVPASSTQGARQFGRWSAWTRVVLIALYVRVFASGFLVHRATRGRRDFAGIQGLEAEQYPVDVDADRPDEAIRESGLL